MIQNRSAMNGFFLPSFQFLMNLVLREKGLLLGNGNPVHIGVRFKCSRDISLCPESNQMEESHPAG